MTMTAPTLPDDVREKLAKAVRDMTYQDGFIRSFHDAETNAIIDAVLRTLDEAGLVVVFKP